MYIQYYISWKMEDEKFEFQMNMKWRNFLFNSFYKQWRFSLYISTGTSTEKRWDGIIWEYIIHLLFCLGNRKGIFHEAINYLSSLGLPLLIEGEDNWLPVLCKYRKNAIIPSFDRNGMEERMPSFKWQINTFPFWETKIKAQGKRKCKWKWKHKHNNESTNETSDTRKAE